MLLANNLDLHSQRHFARAEGLSSMSFTRHHIIRTKGSHFFQVSSSAHYVIGLKFIATFFRGLAFPSYISIRINEFMR